MATFLYHAARGTVALVLGTFAATALLTNSLIFTGLITLATAGSLVRLLEATD